MIEHVLRNPAGHADTPLRDVDAARTRTELGLHPRLPGIRRQQRELNLDPGRLFEGGRDLFGQRALPAALVVADINQLVRLVLGPGGRVIAITPPAVAAISLPMLRVVAGCVGPDRPLTAPEESPATR